MQAICAQRPMYKWWCLPFLMLRLLLFFKKLDLVSVWNKAGVYEVIAGAVQPRKPHSRSAPQGLTTASIQTLQQPQFLHLDLHGSLGTAGLTTPGVSSGSDHPSQEDRVGVRKEPGPCGALASPLASPLPHPKEELREAENWRSEQVSKEESENDDSALGRDFPQLWLLSQRWWVIIAFLPLIFRLLTHSRRAEEVGEGKLPAVWAVPLGSPRVQI